MVMRKVPVGAHYGFKDWLLQRATAVVMAIAMVVVILALCAQQPQNYVEWKEFVLSGWMRLLLLLILLSLVWHAFIGVRDIYMDYIKHTGLRLLKIGGMVVYLLVCFLWGAKILL